MLLTSVYKRRTHEINVGPKPKRERVRKRKAQSTLSKAFSWSRDRMAAGVLVSEVNSTRSLRKATFSPM